MITDMLKGVITSPEGTGTRANISGLYQAGKTGTNAYPSDISAKFPDNAAMDSWFNGYTKHYSVSVWVGYDHQYEAGNYLDNNSVALASLFYKNIMTYMSQGKTNTDWRKPSNVYVRYINGVRQLYLAGSAAPSSELFGSSTSSRSSSSETSSSSSGSSSSSESSASSESSSESSSNSSSSASQSSSQPSRPTDDNSSSANSTPPAEPDSQAENQTTNSGNPPQ